MSGSNSLLARKGIIAALCFVLLCVSSCREEVLPSSARQVRFSASSGFFLPTKTEYAGGYVRDNDYERLNWVTGDGLTILSPQAVFYNKSTNPWTVFRSATNPAYCVADYAVSGTITPDGIYSTAGIAPSGENGLYWGEGAHHFFGVYPAFGSLPADVQSHVGIEIDAARTTATISAFIPGAQTHSGVKDAVKCVHDSSVDSTYIKPQMQYAWMWSAQYAPEAEKETTLLFSPMVTTFQIAVMGSGSEEVPLTRFELESESDALHGEFSAEVWVDGFDTEIKRENVRSKMMSTFTVADPSSSGGNMKVSFAFPENTKVSGSKKVTLTVFVFPKGSYDSETISNVTLRFVSPGVTRSLKLMDAGKNNWVQFPACRKINIDGITLPSQDKPWHFTVTGEDWEDEVSDVVVSPVGIIEMENLDVTDGGTLDERAYVLDVDWSGLTLDEDGGSKSDFATVRSYKDNAAKTPVPYELQYYDETSASWKAWTSSRPVWLTIPAPASSWSGTYAGEELGLSMAALVSTVSNSHTEALRNKKWGGNVPRDLSRYNVATGAEVERTTANCYVLYGHGEYRFPLVYGNGLKDGAENPAAYTQSLVNTSGFPLSFKDHLDRDITTPYIGAQNSGKELVPVIVWSDVPGLVKDLQVSGIGSGAYMNFRVSGDYIDQGNAVIGVLVDGELAWSWHIWVTDQDLTVSDKKEQYAGSNGYVFSPVNLGWCDASTQTFEPRRCSLRVVQPASGLMSDVVVVKQLEENKTYAYTGSNTFYQWGRKDPMPRFGRVQGNSLAAERKLYNSTDPAAYAMQYKVNQGASIGTAIRHPYIQYTNGTLNSWMDDRYFNLWNTNLTAHSQTSADMIKTIYDPSPVGYQVPPPAAWEGFSSSNCSKTGTKYSAGYGFTYSQEGASVFFPAIGRLDNSGTELYQNITESAFYWSSVPAYSGAYYMTWSGSNVSTDVLQHCNYGFAVRPVMEEVVTPPVAAEGCFAVSILQDQFSTAGGTSSIEICSSAFTVSDGYYQSCAPGIPWRIAGYSTDRTSWSSTAPSWFSVTRMSAKPTADEDIRFNFTVSPAASGTTRFVMVNFEQVGTGQTIVLYISQGSTAGSASWETNMMFGSDNSICGSGNVILGSGNFIMGYDNRCEGTGNVAVGYENQNIGTNNYSIGTGNYNRGTGNTCTGSNNSCLGSYNRCGGYWQYEYEKYVIGDANWIAWFGN